MRLVAPGPLLPLLLACSARGAYRSVLPPGDAGMRWRPGRDAAAQPRVMLGNRNFCAKTGPPALSQLHPSPGSATWERRNGSWGVGVQEAVVVGREAECAAACAAAGRAWCLAYTLRGGSLCELKDNTLADAPDLPPDLLNHSGLCAEPPPSAGAGWCVGGLPAGAVAN